MRKLSLKKNFDGGKERIEEYPKKGGGNRFYFDLTIKR